MASAQGIFTGLSVDVVEQIKQAAVKQLIEGKTIMQYSDSGVSVSKQWPIAVDQVLLECNYALRVLDPDTYGSARSTRRVHSNFGSSFGL